MLFCGATFLAPVLDPKTRPGWFIFYWLACAWVTVTAVLLAIFDLLLVRAQARRRKARAGPEGRPRLGKATMQTNDFAGGAELPPLAGNRANKWRRTSARRSRHLRKNRATRAGGNIPEPRHAYRTEFQRDRARIIHSRAFRRLEYKTQVFLNGTAIICARG